MTLKRTQSILSAIGIILTITSVAVFFGEFEVNSKITGITSIIGGFALILFGRYGFKNVDL